MSPTIAINLLRKGSARLTLLLLFIAITSSTSTELIAFSSFLTFDVYRNYVQVRLKATSTKLVHISYYSIILFFLVLGAFYYILNAALINLI